MYLGLALPILLVQLVRLRPNAASDNWSGDSISAYYWTGAVSLFVGLLAALSLFLLTYRGYANDAQKYDRAAAVIAGIGAAVVAMFPTTPPSGIAAMPWWADWVNTVHVIAAITLFSMFAVFSLWLFRRTAPGDVVLAREGAGSRFNQLDSKGREGQSQQVASARRRPSGRTLSRRAE